MRKLSLATAFVAILAAPLACNLDTTSRQIAASHVMVATLLATPPVSIDPAAWVGLADAGLDAGLPDAGMTFDAGVTLDGGFMTVPAQTAAFVFFGTRTSTSLDTAPKGIDGAQVSVLPVGGTATELTGSSAGNYSKTSAEDSSFTYQEGQTYEFRAENGGETFVGEVQSVPALEQIPAFHPAKGYIEQNANASFTFNRPDPPAGKERNLGFVTVYPMSQNGDRGEPTYTNMPSTPLAFLKLVALPAEWKQTTVTIPGTAFPEAEKNYLIVFQAVKLGGAKSENLFAGSAILAGTAEVGVVRTK